MVVGWALIGSLIGLVVGVVVTVVLSRRGHRSTLDAALAAAGADAQARLAAADARQVAQAADLGRLNDRLAAALEETRDARDALGQQRVAVARLETELSEQRERAGRDAAILRQAQDDLSTHFRTLAGEALEQNRARLAEQHHGSLDRILKPLGERIVAFEKRVEETYDKEAQQRFSLRQEVLNLQDATKRINEDAANLTRALKGEAKTRGNWGEVVLERVLERSGLQKGVEYRIQHALRDDDGTLLRPDVVIHLPDDKHVVIDSKVSLVAYDRYHAAADDAGREAAGKAHLHGMRQHVKSLAGKKYQLGEGVDSPDFVAMFVPIEPAYHLAASLDDGLFLDAWDKQVVLVTPSTLMALLMTVQTLWQREKQTRNVLAIADESGKLHAQLIELVKAFDEVGRHLDHARTAFDRTNRRLMSGRGNVIGKIDRLQKLGAKTRKQMPADLLDRIGRDEHDDGDAGDRTGPGGAGGESGPSSGGDADTPASAVAAAPKLSIVGASDDDDPARAPSVDRR